MKPAILLAALGLASSLALAQPQYFDSDLTPEFRAWQAANPWFGKDPKRTQFARDYARKLQQERPELIGKPLLDAVSAKVEQSFGPAGKAQKR